MTESIESSPQPAAVLDTTCPEDQVTTSSCSSDGYTKRFECRPDFRLGGHVVAAVVDASTIRERKVDDLMVARLADVLARSNEVILGFGLPNEFLVAPDGKGGYEKLVVKSLWRAPTVVANTKGWVQSGIWLRLKNLPESAQQRLREEMRRVEGQRFVTCAYGCMRVMQAAGFTSGGESLSGLKMPYACFAHLVQNGLEFNGQPVEVDVIKTAPVELFRFSWRIQKATALTFCRHASRNVETMAKKHKIVALLKTAVTAPGRWLGLGKTDAPAMKNATMVAPALPDGVEYLSDMTVQVSQAGLVGRLVRQIWGSHALFEVTQNRVNPDAFFSTNLEPFPQLNPDRITRLKKHLLFRPVVVKFLLWMLAPRYKNIGTSNERAIYDMLRTSSDEVPEKYNVVVTRTLINGKVGSRIVLSRINAGSHSRGIVGKIARKWAKIADWILSKHVLMSGYDPFVVYAAECWKSADGSINVNMNSGTYQPKKNQQEQAVLFTRAVFPHWTVVMVD